MTLGLKALLLLLLLLHMLDFEIGPCPERSPGIHQDPPPLAAWDVLTRCSSSSEW